MKAPPTPMFLGLPRLAWLLAGAFLLLLLPKIAGGAFWHHDELLTANRTRELLLRDDPFAITLNFSPSVQKPPLQYWVGALLLRALPGWAELALRLPSLLGGAGCLLAVAWLARVYYPAAPTSLAAWSALALAGCGYFVHFARVALLDTNAALFLTLALIGCRLAREDARWHWFTAVQCVLGAWQKAPYGLLAWVVVLAVERRVGSRRHFAGAFWLAAVGSAGWWAVQWLHVDPAVLQTAGGRQLGSFFRAHDPSDHRRLPWTYVFWLGRDWALPGLLAPAAAVAALFGGREGRPLAWVAVIFGGVIACLAYRAERYLVVITPLLALLTAERLQRIAARMPALGRRWLLPATLATTLPVSVFQYFQPPPNQPDLRGAAAALGSGPAAQRILVCDDAMAGFEAPNFVLFYAGLHRPMEALPFREMEGLPEPVGPVRGLCNRGQWERLRRSHAALTERASAGDWVVWSD